MPSSRKVVPSPALRPYVDHFWVERDNAGTTFELLPDGAADLVAVIAGSRIHVLWFGTATRARPVPLLPGAHYVGLRFRAGRQRGFLGASAREITDRVLPADSACASLVVAVAEALLQGRESAACEAALGRLVRPARADDARFERALDVLADSTGRGTVEVAAGTAGMGRRQFERRCLDAVGVTPRQFAALCRFRRAAETLRATACPGLADVAAACGYADQSHMTRAFRLWAGRPPGAFRACLAAPDPMSHSLKTR